MSVSRVLVLVALASLGGVEVVAAGAPPRMFLTWNAPYATPRARENLVVACGDTTRMDTLYICVDPGRDTTTMTAFDVVLWFRPAPGDSLGRHWAFSSNDRPARLVVQFNPDSVPGARRIWTAEGTGGWRAHSLPEGTYSRLIWAVRSLDRAEVYGGNVYCFARVLVPRPARADDCARPACLEIEWSTFAWARGDKDRCYRGSRFVSWNATGADPCGPHREQARVSPWMGPRPPKP